MALSTIVCLEKKKHPPPPKPNPLAALPHSLSTNRPLAAWFSGGVLVRTDALNNREGLKAEMKDKYFSVHQYHDLV